MSAPTPGPWHVGGTGRTVRDLAGREICKIKSQDGLILDAAGNARLIAAAPKLLAACEALHAQLHARLFREQYAEPLRLLSAAIARAKEGNKCLTPSP